MCCSSQRAGRRRRTIVIVHRPATFARIVITIRCSLLVRRPLEEVFAFAADYRNDVRWRGGLVALCCTPDAAPRLGMRVQEALERFGLRAETLAEVIAWEPMRRTALRVLSGPIAGESRRSFEACRTGTRLVYELRLAPQGHWRWLEPPLGLLFRWQALADLRRLRRALEAPLPLPAAVSVSDLNV